MEKQTSLSKVTAWYTTGNLFVRSVSFFLLPLYSNLISTSNFGNYALIMSLYTIISVLYYSGLQSALSKYYLEENDEEKRKEIFSVIFNAVFVTSIILTFVIFLNARWIAFVTTGSEVYTDLIRLAFASLFFECITFILIHLLRTKEQYRKVVAYSTVSAVLNFILNIIFVYYLRKGIYGIILSQLISGVFLFIIMLPLLKRNYKMKFNPRLVKIIYIFSLPLIISGLLSSSVDVIDRFIIDHFLGNSEVGIYSFSYRIALVMNIFVLSLRSAWTPYSIRLFKKGSYNIEFGKSFTKIVGTGLIIFLIVSIFIDDLFNFHLNNIYLLNPQYRDGITIIPVILFSYMFSVIVTFFSVYPYVSGKSIHFLVSDLLAFLLNIPANFILIPLYGIMGAAIATLISYTGAAVYLAIISEKRIIVKYETVKLISICLITISFYAISKLINLFYLDIILSLGAILIFYFLTGIKPKNILKV